MPIVLSFETSRADLVRLGYLGLRARPLTFFSAVLFFIGLPWSVAIGGLMAKAFGLHVPSGTVALMIALPPITVAAFALIPLLLFRGSPTLRGPHRYEFDDRDIHATGPGYDSRIQWSVFTRAMMHRFGLLLLSGRLPMLSVPARAMSASDREALVLLLRQKGLAPEPFAPGP
jgi:hypothetical protein